jgi:hypothetical protein
MTPLTAYDEGHMGPNRKSPPRKNNLEGRYANYFKVGHNAFEFVLDFGQYYPESNKAEMYTRIITSPVYAKRLMKTLKDAIGQHEAQFGRVTDG